MSRILVVDDEEAIRFYLTLLLEDRGYSIKAVADADEALRAMDDEPFDLVCLDIMMPRRSGIWLYSAMRTRPSGRHVPVVFISGFSQVNDLRDERAFRRTVRDESIPMPEVCLEKPVDPAKLLGAIERLTSAPQQTGGLDVQR
ncbi:MAG: response regulator [Acidobacteria bacterium]|nr:response regulator [Acidobacteriota bacterium]